MSSAEAVAVLQLTGFGAAFGHRVVLDGVELSLPGGGVGIDILMGPVKTGKSTLMRALAGHYTGHPMFHQWGQARLQGSAVEGTNRPVLVQQHARLYDQPVHVLLVHRIKQRETASANLWRDKAAAILQQTGLPDVGPLLDRPVLQLPPVLQRCVNIAAHAATTPALLMIDEPTFGLSDLESHSLIAWLKDLSSRQRLLISLHHQQQARLLGDRIVLLGGGRVLAHQDAESFFIRPANSWVEQFIRSGSLSLPAPGARREDLSEDAPAPFTLSEQARAIVDARRPEQAAPVLPQMHHEAAARDHATRQASRVDAECSAAAVAQDPSPARPERKLAVLPAPSRDGVELASAVGTVFVSEYRAPQGFHWIVPYKLAGCAEPGVSSNLDYDLDLLRRAGITTLITLTEKDLDQDALSRHDMKNLHLPIFDRDAPSAPQVHMLLTRMQRLFASGETLAVHCKAGLGRTGTILAAWLIRDGGLSAAVAIERLRRINRGYVQSELQEQFLYAYETDLIQRLRS
jgi:atypical dual specificity phosphatase